MTNISLRTVKVEDAAELLEIYAPYVKNTSITYEYDVPSVEEFENRIKTITQKFPYIVATENEKIIGYAYAGVFHARKAYEHSCELSIYVDINHHHKGVGSALYDELEKRLLEKDITVLYACIASTPRNPDPYLTDSSLRFHEARGFKYAGKFSGCAYKFDRWYNMVYMEKHLTKKDFGFDDSSEVLDIYDVHRQPKGIAINKKINKQAVINYPTDRHSVIHICVFNEDKMLIQQRADTKSYKPSLWDYSIGGHVEAGETPEMGATRELKEELNVDYDFSNHPPHFTINFEKGFDDFFILEKAVDLSKVVLQFEEVQAVKWATKEEINQMIKDGTFINYKDGLTDLLFAMRKSYGAHF